jgi:hypothetical protein
MNPDLSYASDSPNAAQPAPLNFFSRITGIWFSPGETFTEIGSAKGALGTIVAPLLGLIIFGVAFGAVGANRIGLENLKSVAERQIRQSSWIPEDKKDEIIAKQQEKMTLTSVMIQTGVIYGVLYIVFALIIAGVFKLISAVMGWENKFKYLFSVTLYTSLAVGIVFYLIGFILLFLKNPEEIRLETLVGSNLAVVLSAVLGEESVTGFVKGLAMSVDVFAIWKIILLAIGFAAVSRKLKPSTVGTILGVLYALISLVFAPFAGAYS